MAYGKNKGLNKTGKKGQKKKQMDPFLRKVWYDVKAPTYLKSKRMVGRTCVTKTQGTKIETEGLKNRICEFNLADMKDNSEDGHKKIKLEIQEIQGKSCLTEFHGLELTRDRVCSMIKKKHTLVEVRADVKTTDGYVCRIFVIGFTKKAEGAQKVFTFAQHAQIKRIRRRVQQVLQQEVGNAAMKDMVSSLCVDKIESQIKSSVSRIFPLDPVHIYKVKLVKKPKLDITKLMEVHDKGGDEGVEVTGQVAEEAEAKNLLS